MKTGILLFTLMSAAVADDPSTKVVFPQTPAQWDVALDRIEFKGPDPCFYQTKGICEEPDVIREASALVHFDYDSATIKPEFNTALSALGQALQNRLADAALIIEGHTDSDGTEAYNLALSARRAAAVKQYLVDRYRIDPDRLELRAQRESAPLVDNTTEQNKAQNRRVRFVRHGTWMGKDNG